ncbi:MAG: hypothetical protein AAFV53_31720 [Myxococcota bacterium]
MLSRLRGLAVVMGWCVSATASAGPIKTIQPKRHSRIDRWEIAPRVGAVINDPYLRRYLLGAGLSYHPSEIFHVELGGDFSPDLGRADWKPITVELLEERELIASISRWTWSVDASFVFTPFHAKANLFSRIVDLEVYARTGAAMIHTEDDPETFVDPNAASSQATQSENHPAMIAGGGVRAYLSPNTSLRFEVRSVQYLETFNSASIQKKNYAVPSLSAGFLFPTDRADR